MTHSHQGDVEMQDKVRGGAQKAVDEADKDSIPTKVRKVGVLPNKCKIDELGKPRQRERKRERRQGVWEGYRENGVVRKERVEDEGGRTRKGRKKKRKWVEGRNERRGKKDTVNRDMYTSNFSELYIVPLQSHYSPTSRIFPV